MERNTVNLVFWVVKYIIYKVEFFDTRSSIEHGVDDTISSAIK